MAAIGVLAVMGATLLLVKSLQSRYVQIYAYTDDAGGLTEGTPVRLNGIGVGDLDKLILTNSRDPKRKIRLVMKVRREYLAEIPDDSKVGEAATNLLGNYFIDILQGQSPRAVMAGGELQTTVSIDPNKLMGQMGSEFQQIQAIIARADKLLQEVQTGNGNVGMWQRRGLRQMNRVSAEFDKLMNDVQHGQGNLSKVDELSAELDATGTRMREVTAAFQAGGGTAAKLQSVSTELAQMNTEMGQATAALNGPQGPGARMTQIQGRVDELAGKLQSTMDHINAGQGTLGQFTVNPQLSESLANTGATFRKLAQDIRANPRKFLSLQVKFF